MDDSTITAEALAAMTIEQCIQRGDEKTAKGDAAEKEAKRAYGRSAEEKAKADEAKVLALIHFRDAGKCYNVANKKAATDGVDFMPLVEAKGKRKSSVYDCMKIDDNWDRIMRTVFQQSDGTAGNQQTLPKLPTSKRAFLRALKELDGSKRDSGDNTKKGKDKTPTSSPAATEGPAESTAPAPQLYDAPPDEPEDNETTENQATRLWDVWESVSVQARDMVVAAKLDEVEAIVKRVKPQVEADRERLSRNAA